MKPLVSRLRGLLKPSAPPRRGPANGKRSSLTAFFCVEPGKLEWQSILLSASLAAFCKDRPNLIAFSPRRQIPRLRAATLENFEKLGVEIRPLPTPPFVSPYPHGNKILAAAERLPTRYGMFLDSDTMLTRSTNYSLLQGYELGVVPAYRRSWAPRRLAPWRAAYRAAGLVGPRCHVRYGNGNPGPAYYNAGFVFFDSATDFGPAWLDTAVAIDRNNSVEDKRPWLDQIALPVTEEKLGLNTIVLPPGYNTQLDEKTELDESIFLAHYHGGMKGHGKLIQIANYVLGHHTKVRNLDALHEALPADDAKLESVVARAGAVI